MSLEPASKHTFHCNVKNDIMWSLNLVQPKTLNLYIFKILYVTSTETLSCVGTYNFSAGKGASAWVSNPLPIRLCYASRGHIFLNFVHTTKNIGYFKELGIPVTVSFRRAAREPAYSNGQKKKKYIWIHLGY